MSHASSNEINQALCWAEFSTSALLQNCKTLKQLAGSRDLILVIKADAYGHGLYEVASRLDKQEEAGAFAVARVEEAIYLREKGITKRLIVLSGVTSLAHLKLCHTHNLEVVIHSFVVFHYWQQAFANHLEDSPKLWLKINSGMNRLGLNHDECLEIFSFLEAMPPQDFSVFSMKLVGVMTHFSSSESANTCPTQNQMQRTAHLLAQSPRLTNLHQQQTLSLCYANSGAIVYHPDSHFDAVRAGIALYGMSPNAQDAELQAQLQPVMRFKAKIIALQNCKTGETIGYNETYTVEEDGRYATVAVGYADGYPRHAPSGCKVFINGTYAELAGRVSMDLISIKLGNIPADIGDTVELWGENILCSDVATAAGTISYELLTKVSNDNIRLKRYWLD